MQRITGPGRHQGHPHILIRVFPIMPRGEDRNARRSRFARRGALSPTYPKTNAIVISLRWNVYAVIPARGGDPVERMDSYGFLDSRVRGWILRASASSKKGRVVWRSPQEGTATPQSMQMEMATPKMVLSIESVVYRMSPMDVDCAIIVAQ